MLYLLHEALDTILVKLDMGVHTSTHTYLHTWKNTHTHLAESDMPIPHGSAVPYHALSTSSSASDIILLTDSRDMCGVNGSEPDRYWEGDTGGYIKVDRIKLNWKIQLKGT